MGDLGKLVATVALIGSLVMMISGYQDASGPVWWGRQPFWVSISNVLMLLAFYLMVASSMKVGITLKGAPSPANGYQSMECVALVGERRLTFNHSLWRTFSLGCGQRDSDQPSRWQGRVGSDGYQLGKRSARQCCDRWFVWSGSSRPRLSWISGARLKNGVSAGQCRYCACARYDG